LKEFRVLEEHHKMLKMFINKCEVSQELLESRVFQELVKRRLIITSKKKLKVIKLAISVDEALRIIEYGEGISRLTRDIIVNRVWEKARIKPYNIEALPPIKYCGKKHFFKEFIEMLKEIMDSLGFSEVKDDYVIPELWNFDILFQAQDHPSRDIHDILIVEGSADLSGYADIVERTRNVHEKGGTSGSMGWGYKWSLEKASKLILRSHTTAVTARYLMLYREPPVRLYTIDRVFRRDNPDARHSPEFTNFDGVIMERDFSFRKLLGLLSQILKQLGIKEFKFKPAYFPFTEPSVEGYGYVAGYGWIEVFGAGMFRPEVLEILGIRYPVGAWGMGVERLAMVVYGIEDIRLLFSRDIEFVRKFQVSRVYRSEGV
ncbi:MAG: phenylalanine--tRNA ligase subunit alpha, partial [Ignisphaera sp.]